MTEAAEPRLWKLLEFITGLAPEPLPEEPKAMAEIEAIG